MKYKKYIKLKMKYTVLSCLSFTQLLDLMHVMYVHLSSCISLKVFDFLMPLEVS